MAKSRKIFAAYPGAMLGLSAPDTAIRWENISVGARRFWLNLPNDYDLTIAEGGGMGRAIKPRKIAYGDVNHLRVQARASQLRGCSKDATPTWMTICPW